MLPLVLAIVGGGIALVFAAILGVRVLSADPGTPKMVEIAEAIKEGSQAFLRRAST